MKRFITYLFTYEDGRKGKNIGFIRTDIRKERVELEIHAQGIGRFSGNAQVFLLVGDGTLRGIPAGVVAVNLGRGTGKTAYDMRDTGENGYGAEDVEGVAIRFGDAYYAASSWKDETAEGFADGRFAEWMPGAAVPQPEAVQSTAAQAQPTAVQPQPTVVQSQPTAGQRQSTAVQPQDARSELVRIVEEKLQQSKESPDMQPSLRRIDISDIRRLPKKNWYLCNNSFLIHGYFNYKYLVVVEREENGRKKTYLGVPGIFEKPERMMAMLFGFPDFLPKNGGETGDIPACSGQNRTGTLPGGSAVCCTDGTFGYWLSLLDV